MSNPDYFLAVLEQGGEKALDEFISERQSEALSLDFKRAATDGTTARLHDDDRKNLAKAISGFGNTSGGIVVWGVDCRNLPERGDVAQAKFPIPNVRRFLSLLEAGVAGATSPSHTGVEHRVIAERPDGSGYVVSVIPEADNFPLQVPGKFVYYMRAGSSFEPIPHSILSGMFGRRPAPQFQIDVQVNQNAIVKDVEVSAGVVISITNVGAGVGNEVFIALEMLSLPNGEGSLKTSWTEDWRFERPTNGPGTKSAITSIGHRMPPGSHAQTFQLLLACSEPVHRPLEIRITCGSGNGPPTHRVLTQTANRLRHTVQVGRNLASTPTRNEAWVAARLFGLVDD